VFTASLTLRTSTVGNASWRATIWRQRIVESNDLAALRLALIGLHRHAIEMREASPMGGLLPDEERREALGHNE